MFDTRSMIQTALVALVIAACAKEAPPTPAAPPPPDPAAVRSTIEAANAKAATAMMAGDTATAWAHYTDDAVIMMANEKPWRGRAEWTKGFGVLMSFMTLKEVAFRTSDVMIEGDVAVETGEYTMTLQPKGGKEMKDEGKYLTVWKKQGDGSWKVVRDISNTSLPAR
jgi:ketosteroid isomerase-like protein